MRINILGIRGIPAAHGGFETFAARLAPYLQNMGHDVTVYCQEDNGDPGPWEDTWEGIRRIHFCPKRRGPIGTIEFDLASIRHVIREPDGVDLVLGYNTAILCVLQRLRGRRVVMNMDGIEWKRTKWSLPIKAWFYLNELIGANLCDIAVADHPEIALHTNRRRLKNAVMIPYGADSIREIDPAPVLEMGLKPDRYFLSIGRIEPENSIREIVAAFSTLESDTTCVVLGELDAGNAYHRSVQKAACPKVKFVGAIYDPIITRALRAHCRAYLHGHQVGGTNPSLVEALGAGNAVIACDNRFNRWTAGSDQLYFRNIKECVEAMEKFLNEPSRLVQARDGARKRHTEFFQWEPILKAYADVLLP